MIAIIFENQNALFEFNQKDVSEHLQALTTEHDINEAASLLKLIKSASSQATFMLRDLHYARCVVMDLVAAGKGSVTCKVCDKTYAANQLRETTVGHGKNPFEIKIKKKGALKNLFRKYPGMFGGKAIECPEGHELISAITWRT